MNLKFVLAMVLWVAGISMIIWQMRFWYAVVTVIMLGGALFIAMDVSLDLIDKEKESREDNGQA